MDNADIRLERRLSQMESKLGHIAENMEKLGKKMDAALSSDVQQLKIDLAVIKARATIYGAIGGTILGAVMSIIIGIATKAVG